MGHRGLTVASKDGDLVVQCRDRHLDRGIAEATAEGTDTLTEVEALRFSDRPSTSARPSRTTSTATASRTSSGATPMAAWPTGRCTG